MIQLPRVVNLLGWELTAAGSTVTGVFDRRPEGTGIAEEKWDVRALCGRFNGGDVETTQLKSYLLLLNFETQCKSVGNYNWRSEMVASKAGE